jgi:cytochrome c peroxidase
MKHRSLLILSGAGLLLGTLLTIRALAMRNSSAAASATHVISIDERKVALGRDLFVDHRLSRSTRLNCASCHDLTTNGASANSRDRDDFGRPLRFNTPSVFNSALSFRMGWEGQVRTSEGISLQALQTMLWGGGVAARRLASDRAMAIRFQQIYGAQPSDSLIADALGAYVKTLMTYNAPFDRWRAGDRQALTAQQVRGYERFQELGCSSCHQGRNVGANILQHSNVYSWLSTNKLNYVRVPSLRNVATTAPYFDNGGSETLERTIRRMGESQLDVELSRHDVDDIAAFLKSLTGSYRGHSLRPAKPTLPK